MRTAKTRRLRLRLSVVYDLPWLQRITALVDLRIFCGQVVVQALIIRLHVLVVQLLRLHVLVVHLRVLVLKIKLNLVLSDQLRLDAFCAAFFRPIVLIMFLNLLDRISLLTLFSNSA